MSMPLTLYHYSFVDRIKFVIKQGISHGRNLGLFVFIYKSICWACRQVGISGGVESWIAGFIGGFIGFGDSKGISGSVNNQITLYLFARYVSLSSIPVNLFISLLTLDSICF
jgi:hypothetical protein